METFKEPPMDSAKDPRVQHCAKMLYAGGIIIKEISSEGKICPWCESTINHFYVSLITTELGNNKFSDKKDVCMGCAMKSITWMFKRIIQIQKALKDAMKGIFILLDEKKCPYQEYFQDLGIENGDFADKWKDESTEEPVCAICEETVQVPDSGIRLWRPHSDPARALKGEKQEMAFHFTCFMGLKDF